MLLLLMVQCYPGTRLGRQGDASLLWLDVPYTTKLSGPHGFKLGKKIYTKALKTRHAGIQKTLSLRAGWPQTLKLEMLTGDWPQLQTTLPHNCILMQKVHKQGITGPMGKSKLSVAFPVNLILRRIPSQDGGNVPLFQPAGCAHQHT